MSKTEKKVLKKIEESLKNLEGVKITNKLKAEAVYFALKDYLGELLEEQLSEQLEKSTGCSQ